MKTPYFINSTNILIGIRFVAKIMALGLICLSLYLYFSMPVSKRGIDVQNSTFAEMVMTLSFICALVGLVLAFKFEGLGGILTLVGLIAFSIAYYYSAGKVLWKIWIFGIPAVLFIFTWWMTNYADEYDVYRS